MEKTRRDARRVVAIHVKPYLAEYANTKYSHNPETGGIQIPYFDDLYHCVWHYVGRRCKNSHQYRDPNLQISLGRPDPATEGRAWKDPAYHNHLSTAGRIEVERCLQRQFDFELHRAFLENEERGEGRLRQLDVALAFIKEYRLKSISEEALLKNFHRYRNLLRPKKPRRYDKIKRRKPYITVQNRIS